MIYFSSKTNLEQLPDIIPIFNLWRKPGKKNKVLTSDGKPV